MIFEPTHPRKNITLSITGVSETIQKTKETISKKMDQEGFCFEKF
jgi:hypothetical protein